MSQPKLSQALTAEFVGTFALIFIGAGAGALGVAGLAGVALAHGLVVLAFAYSFGHISGTHINPAVTIGLLAAKAIDPRRAFSYIVFQLAGGVAGALLLRVVLGSSESGLGATVLGAGMTPGRGLLLEAVLAFFLVTAVLHCAVAGKAGNHAGLAIGLTLAFCIMMGGPLTGGSLNPARSLGPAVVLGNFADLWIYLVGPPLGGLAAAALYKFLK